jgi:hypothetical protein
MAGTEKTYQCYSGNHHACWNVWQDSSDGTKHICICWCHEREGTFEWVCMACGAAHRTKENLIVHAEWAHPEKLTTPPPKEPQA